MSTSPSPLPATRRLQILGDVGPADFRTWTLRHARRLGLRCSIVAHGPDCLEVLASGPDELLEALALGCSLGPQSVLVDRVETSPVAAETPFPDA
jgi:acylphosphatase